MDANRLFVEEFANPHAWFLMAGRLHEQAIFLYAAKEQSRLMRADAQRFIQTSVSSGNNSVFLLAGFALENAIKSFLVYENPDWISDGRLGNKLKSHRLANLSRLSQKIPRKKSGIPVLERFEEGLDNWARYPCALNVEKSLQEFGLSTELWAKYISLMAAYGKRLTELLSKHWAGPHGFIGRYTFEGEHLGYQVPSEKGSRSSKCQV